jgi:hypothetical protein
MYYIARLIERNEASTYQPFRKTVEQFRAEMRQDYERQLEDIRQQITPELL